MIKVFLFITLLINSAEPAWAGSILGNINDRNERVQNVIIPAVDFTCIQVLPNGDVTLNWTPSIAGTGVFVEYQLFSVQGGAAPIATFGNINTNTYTHAGAGANLNAMQYYLATVSDCNGVMEMSLSDTVSSIFLEINDLGDGRVFVEWNPTQDPQISGENSSYNILREYPAGVWQVRKSIPYGQFNYRDTIDICSAFFSYQIEVSHSSGCTSTSNIKGDFFQDIINPYIPIVSYVSVDSLSQNATVHWNQNQAPDTYGYVIRKQINGFWENIDTVYGIANTTYADFNSIEDVQSETYAIAAFDSCLVLNVPPNYQTSAASSSHSTIHAETTIDICAQTLKLDWTSYEGWIGNESVQKYEVLLKKGAGKYTVIADLSPDKSGFNYEGLIANEKYCFIVKATSNLGKISFSNQVCNIIVPPANPQFHYLSKASHLIGNQLEIELYTDPTVNAISYDIYKKGPRDFQFSILESIAPNNQSFYSYLDNDVGDRGFYEYKIGIVDSCNNTNTITPVTRTIYLTIDREGPVNTLTWTGYEGFAGLISEYNIYRGYDGNYSKIATNPAAVRTFTDDLSAVFDAEGGFCYKVEAVESTNQFGFSKSSFSNEVCLTLDPIVYIPSAFTVCGINNEFKPVIDLYDSDTYEMEIFNREGGKLFVTSDIDNGWDGRMPAGGLAQEGVYVFRITFRDAEGKRYEKTGTVALLRR